MVVGHGVEELDPAAGGGHPLDGLLQGLGDEPVLVHGHVHHIGLVGGERAQGAHVGGRLGQDHVTGINEDPGDQIQRLLRTHRDHDVVGVRPDTLQRHDLADPLAQARVTLSGAVLQCGGALLGDQAAHHLPDRFQGQG